MKIAFLAAGAGGMYCGSCLRDNALALAMRPLGHEMTLVPVYTPLRLDETSAAQRQVLFGAVDVYLQEKFPSLRTRRGVLGRLLGSQLVLRWLSRLSLGMQPEPLGRLTVSVLRGEHGNQKRSLQELVTWLKRHVRPDVIHLTNALLVGFAEPLSRELGVPVICGLQGEDLFLGEIPEALRAEAVQLVAASSRHVDRFLATSSYYAERARAFFGLDASAVRVVRSGIRLDDFPEESDPDPQDRPVTIGYLARLAPEKGLHILIDAFRMLAERYPDLRLKVGGYLSRQNLSYVASLRRLLTSAGLSSRVEILGTLDRSRKLALLRSIDVFSVPTVYPEPKGIFVLEALASGVPVVLPRHGAFPELVEATRGGLLHEPEAAEDLAGRLASLLEDDEQRRLLGEGGRSAVRSEFSAERMARETLEQYQEVLGSREESTAGR
jgi:glycosyltransferase involved in cell wall biosynthesis